MQEFEHIHTFYFLGIGGIGMSALARYFAANGYLVKGYDRTPSVLTSQLEAEGISVQYDADLEVVSGLDVDSTVVVRTPAVADDFALLVWLRERGFRILKRAEVLGMVTRHSCALCVAGTHGKTTTSTMLAHILHGSHLGASAFLGGIANNYHSNLLLDTKSDLVVVEADEFDRSFHHLTPYMSVITSMDADHLDVYGTEAAYRESFVHYAGLVQKALVVHKRVMNTREWLKVKGERRKAKVYSYVVGEKADFYADNVIVQDGAIWFDFHSPSGVLNGVRLGVPSWVNIENSVAAMAMAQLMGATDEELRRGVESYTGVYRRFDQHVNTTAVAYLDDYAHHPQEIKATLESIRKIYPNRYMIGVFQPHLYSRTRDLAEDFAEVLGGLDELLLLPIYPARELPIEGVTSEWLLGKVKIEGLKALVKKEEVVEYLRERITELMDNGQNCVLITMGAGDIDRLVNDITKTLMNENNG